ncbi:(2Fe-2S)-binding protein [Caballeronia sp. dw_19]|uniref:(2Fe-2S)-binding protein n=1 Tax=Caballeronia sp. dw_19 TaxID=2719791 RepID=UPI001BD234E1|nr:(2Fe-2S)-binding protein [Caballeronia sp. dw_19]
MSDRKTEPGAFEQDSEEPSRLSLSRREAIKAMVTGAGAAAVASIPGVATSGTPPVAQAPSNSAPVPTTVVRMSINGEAKALAVDPRQSILDVLRETLVLTGTKKGCNQGACGACTVLIDGKRVNSCLTLAIMHEGAEIRTIEGLADGDRLHPLQQAFIEHEGFQCGYCTSGQIMSGVGCIAEGHTHSTEEIKFWMSGNICRCGAYPGIVAAVSDASGKGRA